MISWTSLLAILGMLAVTYPLGCSVFSPFATVCCRQEPSV